ncbi:MAG: hypothetical protein H0V82_00580 [Candidatus Protochlamydia sp.]|nr:hypothetical protein [Candidatus Protochlamydia sp.]
MINNSMTPIRSLQELQFYQDSIVAYKDTALPEIYVEGPYKEEAKKTKFGYVKESFPNVIDIHHIYENTKAQYKIIDFYCPDFLYIRKVTPSEADCLLKLINPSFPDFFTLSDKLNEIVNLNSDLIKL